MNSLSSLFNTSDMYVGEPIMFCSHWLLALIWNWQIMICYMSVGNYNISLGVQTKNQVQSVGATNSARFEVWVIYTTSTTCEVFCFAWYCDLADFRASLLGVLNIKIIQWQASFLHPTIDLIIILLLSLCVPHISRTEPGLTMTIVKWQQSMVVRFVHYC